ncbi:hypothetical protein PR048_024913 [Dryococelus australis]|uniref:Uncharacterized protein n=1 Tax=Dryococelus australis TaxID=614101 RepID=A0ABQ9GPY9_9NEOP|nr:hypothetical protein PR048_024913 [Dryococelus australis]
MLLVNETLKSTKQSGDKKKDRKCVAIEHAIISAVRPRSFISSLPFGLSVWILRWYGSRLLINVLANLGACASYTEAVMFESSVTAHARAEIDGVMCNLYFIMLTTTCTPLMAMALPVPYVVSSV